MKKMRMLNLLSAIAFIISSGSLFAIPFIDIGDELPGIAFVIAAIYWSGLLIGIGLQIFLSVKCKRMSLKKRNGPVRILYAVAAISFVTFIVLAVMRSKSSIAVVSTIFITFISLQGATVIKRKGCLK